MRLANRFRSCLGFFAVSLFALSAIAQEREDASVSAADLRLLQPPWESAEIFRESFILIQAEADGPLVGRLAFPVEQLVELRSADGSRTFEEGKDFELAADRRSIRFAADADVPFVKETELYVPVGSPDSYAHRKGNPEQGLLFRRGDWFHARQLEATYRRAATEWSGWRPAIAEGILTKTLAHLRAGEPLKVVVAGDSIAAGGDASGTFGSPPRMPPFPQLFVDQLEATYGSDVALTNLAVGGTSVAQGVEALPKYVAEKPDLLIVAFGMNDVGRRDPAWFGATTKKLLDGIRETLPETEVLLVAPMIGNEEWVHTPREMFPLYRDELAKLAGPGVALADVTSVWATLLQHKRHLDMTGNGLNHPNDFGHRLYAQALLGLLVEPESGP